MMEHPVNVKQLSLDRINHLLNERHDRVIDQHHAFAIAYTAALATNPDTAAEIASDLKIPLTAAIRQIAQNAIGFATIHRPGGEDRDAYSVAEYQEDDITFFLVCSLAASFIKDFGNHKVICKLLLDFGTSESIIDDVLCLTFFVHTLVAASKVDLALVKTPVRTKLAAIAS